MYICVNLRTNLRNLREIGKAEAGSQKSDHH